jgi:hypothetical protein
MIFSRQAFVSRFVWSGLSLKITPISFSSVKDEKFRQQQPKLSPDANRISASTFIGKINISIAEILQNVQ